MEDTWRHIASKLQRCVKAKHIKGIEKRLHSPALLERWPWNHLEIQRHNSSCNIDAKVYKFRRNMLLSSPSAVEKIVSKSQNRFQWNESSASYILTIRRIDTGVDVKDSEATLQRALFSNAFDSSHRKKKLETITSIWSLKRNCFCYNDALQITKKNDLLSWWWHQVFEHCWWGHALAPYLLIICLDFIHQA